MFREERPPKVRTPGCGPACLPPCAHLEAPNCQQGRPGLQSSHLLPLGIFAPCRDSAPAETPPLQRLRPCRDSAPAETTPPLQRRLRPCRMTLGRTVHHTMGPAETPAHPPLQCCLAVLPGILPSPVGTRLSYPTTEGGEPACRKGGPWGARSRGDHRRQPASQPLV